MIKKDVFSELSLDEKKNYIITICENIPNEDFAMFSDGFLDPIASDKLYNTIYESIFDRVYEQKMQAVVKQQANSKNIQAKLSSETMEQDTLNKLNSWARESVNRKLDSNEKAILKSIDTLQGKDKDENEVIDKALWSIRRDIEAANKISFQSKDVASILNGFIADPEHFCAEMGMPAIKKKLQWIFGEYNKVFNGDPSGAHFYKQLLIVNLLLGKHAGDTEVFDKVVSCGSSSTNRIPGKNMILSPKFIKLLHRFQKRNGGSDCVIGATTINALCDATGVDPVLGKTKDVAYTNEKGEVVSKESVEKLQERKGEVLDVIINLGVHWISYLEKDDHATEEGLSMARNMIGKLKYYKQSAHSLEQTLKKISGTDPVNYKGKTMSILDALFTGTGHGGEKYAPYGGLPVPTGESVQYDLLGIVKKTLANESTWGIGKERQEGGAQYDLIVKDPKNVNLEDLELAKKRYQSKMLSNSVLELRKIDQRHDSRLHNTTDFNIAAASEGKGSGFSVHEVASGLKESGDELKLKKTLEGVNSFKKKVDLRFTSDKPEDQKDLKDLLESLDKAATTKNKRQIVELIQKECGFTIDFKQNPDIGGIIDDFLERMMEFNNTKNGKIAEFKKAALNKKDETVADLMTKVAYLESTISPSAVVTNDGKTAEEILIRPLKDKIEKYNNNPNDIAQETANAMRETARHEMFLHEFTNLGSTVALANNKGAVRALNNKVFERGIIGEYADYKGIGYRFSDETVNKITTTVVGLAAMIAATVITGGVLGIVGMMANGGRLAVGAYRTLRVLGNAKGTMTALNASRNALWSAGWAGKLAYLSVSGVTFTASYSASEAILSGHANKTLEHIYRDMTLSNIAKNAIMFRFLEWMQQSAQFAKLFAGANGVAQKEAFSQAAKWYFTPTILRRRAVKAPLIAAGLTLNDCSFMVAKGELQLGDGQALEVFGESFLFILVLDGLFHVPGKIATGYKKLKNGDFRVSYQNLKTKAVSFAIITKANIIAAKNNIMGKTNSPASAPIAEGGTTNTGNANTGNANTGNANTGNANTGTTNTGNANTGNANTGTTNTGITTVKRTAEIKTQRQDAGNSTQLTDLKNKKDKAINENSNIQQQYNEYFNELKKSDQISAQDKQIVGEIQNKTNNNDANANIIHELHRLTRENGKVMELINGELVVCNNSKYNGIKSKQQLNVMKAKTLLEGGFTPIEVGVLLDYGICGNIKSGVPATYQVEKGASKEIEIREGGTITIDARDINGNFRSNDYIIENGVIKNKSGDPLTWGMREYDGYVIENGVAMKVENGKLVVERLNTKFNGSMPIDVKIKYPLKIEIKNNPNIIAEEAVATEKGTGLELIQSTHKGTSTKLEKYNGYKDMKTGDQVIIDVQGTTNTYVYEGNGIYSSVSSKIGKTTFNKNGKSTLEVTYNMNGEVTFKFDGAESSPITKIEVKKGEPDPAIRGVDKTSEAVKGGKNHVVDEVVRDVDFGKVTQETALPKGVEYNADSANYVSVKLEGEAQSKSYILDKNNKATAEHTRKEVSEKWTFKRHSMDQDSRYSYDPLKGEVPHEGNVRLEKREGNSGNTTRSEVKIKDAYGNEIVGKNITKTNEGYTVEQKDLSIKLYDKNLKEIDTKSSSEAAAVDGIIGTKVESGKINEFTHPTKADVKIEVKIPKGRDGYVVGEAGVRLNGDSHLTSADGSTHLVIDKNGKILAEGKQVSSGILTYKVTLENGTIKYVPKNSLLRRIAEFFIFRSKQSTTAEGNSKTKTAETPNQGPEIARESVVVAEGPKEGPLALNEQAAKASPEAKVENSVQNSELIYENTTEITYKTEVVTDKRFEALDPNALKNGQIILINGVEYKITKVTTGKHAFIKVESTGTGRDVKSFNVKDLTTDIAALKQGDQFILNNKKYTVTETFSGEKTGVKAKNEQGREEIIFSDQKGLSPSKVRVEKTSQREIQTPIETPKQKVNIKRGETIIDANGKEYKVTMRNEARGITKIEPLDGSSKGKKTDFQKTDKELIDQGFKRKVETQKEKPPIVEEVIEYDITYKEGYSEPQVISDIMLSDIGTSIQKGDVIVVGGKNYRVNNINTSGGKTILETKEIDIETGKVLVSKKTNIDLRDIKNKPDSYQIRTKQIREVKTARAKPVVKETIQQSAPEAVQEYTPAKNLKELEAEYQSLDGSIKSKEKLNRDVQSTEKVKLETNANRVSKEISKVERDILDAENNPNLDAKAQNERLSGLRNKLTEKQKELRIIKAKQSYNKEGYKLTETEAERFADIQKDIDRHKNQEAKTGSRKKGLSEVNQQIEANKGKVESELTSEKGKLNELQSQYDLLTQKAIQAEERLAIDTFSKNTESIKKTQEEINGLNKQKQIISEQIRTQTQKVQDLETTKEIRIKAENQSLETRKNILEREIQEIENGTYKPNEGTITEQVNARVNEPVIKVDEAPSGAEPVLEGLTPEPRPLEGSLDNSWRRSEEFTKVDRYKRDEDGNIYIDFKEGEVIPWKPGCFAEDIRIYFKGGELSLSPTPKSSLKQTDLLADLPIEIKDFDFAHVDGTTKLPQGVRIITENGISNGKIVAIEYNGKKRKVEEKNGKRVVTEERVDIPVPKPTPVAAEASNKKVKVQVKTPEQLTLEGRVEAKNPVIDGKENAKFFEREVSGEKEILLQITNKKGVVKEFTGKEIQKTPIGYKIIGNDGKPTWVSENGFNQTKARKNITKGLMIASLIGIVTVVGGQAVKNSIDESETNAALLEYEQEQEALASEEEETNEDPTAGDLVSGAKAEVLDTSYIDNPISELPVAPGPRIRINESPSRANNDGATIGDLGGENKTEVGALSAVQISSTQEGVSLPNITYTPPVIGVKSNTGELNSEQLIAQRTIQEQKNNLLNVAKRSNPGFDFDYNSRRGIKNTLSFLTATLDTIAGEDIDLPAAIYKAKEEIGAGYIMAIQSGLSILTKSDGSPYNPESNRDAIWGVITKGAVTDFQSDNGLTNNGRPDDETLSKIAEKLA